MVFEELELRVLLSSSAFDLIGLTDMRDDPAFAGIDGSGVSVAIIDTGLDKSHPLLADGYLAGADLVYGGTNPTPTDAHGTHVAGIVGARDPDIGVAPGVGLIGLQVFTRTRQGISADNRDIEQALEWVLAHKQQYNIVAVNMSLGEGFYESAADAGPSITQDDIHRLEAAGVTVISAAGNSFKDHEYKNAAAPGVYSTLDVGAVWQDGVNSNVQFGDGATDYTTGPDRITSFSQRPADASNTIFAPGAMILSTVPGDPLRPNRLESMAGTSMASPMVAGSVALLQEAAMQFGGRYLSPAEVRQVLLQTADNIFDGDDENDNVLNTQAFYPRLDIYAALQKVKADFANIAAPGEGNVVGDVNGTIAGAYLGPDLTGAPTDAIWANIGTDGAGNTIGPMDVDLYKIHVLTDGILTVDLSSRAGGTGFDSFLRLFNGAGAEVANNDDKRPDMDFYSTITQYVQAGTYYVGVSGSPNSGYDPNVPASGVAGAMGDYSLTFAMSGNDPNGVMPGALELNLGSDREPQLIQGIIGWDFNQEVGLGDVDLYKVVMPDNGTLFIDIDTPFRSGYLDSYLRIFDDTGAPLLHNDDYRPWDRRGHRTDSYIAGGVQRGTVYYIGVSDFHNFDYDPANINNRPEVGSGGLYDLYITFQSDDRNGSITQALGRSVVKFPAVNQQGVIGQDTDLYTGQTVQVGSRDVDFFKIISATAGILEININAHDDAVNPQGEPPVDAVLKLWTAGGQLLASNDDSGDSLDPFLQYPIAAKVAYYVSVSGYGNDSFDPFALGSGSDGEVGYYEFNSRLRPNTLRRSLTDNVLASPILQDMTVDEMVGGNIGNDGGFMVGQADVDIYRFVAPADAIYSFTTQTFTENSSDTVLRVFTSSGAEIGYNDDADETTRASSVQLALSAGQTYYIGVNGYSAKARSYNPLTGAKAALGSTGDYQLLAQAITAPADQEIRAAQRIGRRSVELYDNQTGVVNFGSVLRGVAPPSRIIEISNPGTADLAINNITLPAGFQLVGTAPTTLTPGQTGTFMVRMPTAPPGTKSGMIVIDNNDGDEPLFRIPVYGVVKGRATKARPAARPAAISSTPFSTGGLIKMPLASDVPQADAADELSRLLAGG